MTPHTPALDGLRGIAILLVLLHHFTILQPVNTFDHWLYEISLIGWAGVDLFFVLSGFLITGILIDTRGSDRYFTSFYARRTLRIFPLYYLVVFISFIVLPRFPALYDLLVLRGAPEDQLPYWLYLTNFAVAERNAFVHGILDVAWSLAIEEQFYLVWAAVVWLCRPGALGLLCAAIVAATPVARVVAVAEGATPIDVYVLTFYRMDALAAGALLAWSMRRGAFADRGWIAATIAVIAGLGTAVVCWIDGDGWWWNPWMQRVGYSLIALTGAGMLVAGVTLRASNVWPRLLSAGWLRAFGKYSYCLYLIHLPVMRTVRAYVLPADQFAAFGSVWIGQLAFYTVATSLALAVAWLSWRLFEAPILRLKSKFAY